MEHFNLNNTPKIKPGFKEPEGYFESFTDRLMQQLPEQKVKVVPLYRRKPVWMSAVAAVFIAMMGLIFMFNQSPETAAPDDTAIEDYLVHQTNISTYDLMQDLDEQDIAELETSMVISDDAIEDYLSNENIYIND